MKIRSIEISYTNAQDERIATSRVHFTVPRTVKSNDEMKRIAKRARANKRGLPRSAENMLIRVKVEGGRWFIWSE